MADKKLNSVSSVTDAAFVYAETSNGETVKISKADLASVVAGVMGRIKFGLLPIGTTSLTLGSGFLFLNIGASHAGFYHLDYWTNAVTLIGGKELGDLGEISQSEESKYVFNITMNNAIARYIFIGNNL